MVAVLSSAGADTAEAKVDQSPSTFPPSLRPPDPALLVPLPHTTALASLPLQRKCMAKMITQLLAK